MLDKASVGSIVNILSVRINTLEGHNPQLLVIHFTHHRTHYIHNHSSSVSNTTSDKRVSSYIIQYQQPLVNSQKLNTIF